MSRKGLTDCDEFQGHKPLQEMEQELQRRNSFLSGELPCSGRQDQCVPCSNGQRANEEVFMRRKMGGQVERGGQCGGHGGTKESSPVVSTIKP